MRISSVPYVPLCNNGNAKKVSTHVLYECMVIDYNHSVELNVYETTIFCCHFCFNIYLRCC